MSDLATVESRIRSLERCRRLWATVSAVVVAALAVVAATPSAARRGDPELEAVARPGVDAPAFRLLGPDGTVAAELKIGEAGPGLFLLDGEGRERVAIVHQVEQSGLFIKDADGHSRIDVAQFAHGGGGVALHGEEMKGAAVLYLEGDGSLSFYDREGGVRMRLPVEEPAP
jgi:hypothetical protein